MSDPIVPEIWSTILAARSGVQAARRLGQSVGFVPTMGALHEGHAALIRAARRSTDFVVVSLFVNPTQFGPNEDYHKYPRTGEADVQLAARAGAQAIFAPSVEEMYPDPPVSFVEVTQLDKVLCGLSRPGHFRGVCTVVAKLFHIVEADVAVFGQKDAQQATIIRQMVRDLNFPITIQVEPTIREADGLALSSRNRYLGPDERAVAPRIYGALQTVRDRAAAGEADVATLESSLLSLLKQIPGARVDYAQIVSADRLEPMNQLDRPALAAVAVYLGSTRLIDNITLP